MKLITITNTAKDLALEDHPFVPNNTVVIANLSAGTLTVEQSDSSGSGYTTLIAIPTVSMVQVTPTKQFVRLSSAGTVYVLNN